MKANLLITTSMVLGVLGTGAAQAGVYPAQTLTLGLNVDGACTITVNNAASTENVSGTDVAMGLSGLDGGDVVVDCSAGAFYVCFDGGLNSEGVAADYRALENADGGALLSYSLQGERGGGGPWSVGDEFCSTYDSNYGTETADWAMPFSHDVAMDGNPLNLTVTFSLPMTMAAVVPGYYEDDVNVTVVF